LASASEVKIVSLPEFLALLQRACFKLVAHCELAGYCAVLWGRRGRGDGSRRGLRTGKLRNGAEQPAAITKRNPDVLQIPICQIAQNARIDVAFGKALRILGQAE
jgi:hypothetical protein